MHNIIYDIDYIKSGEDKNDLPGCRIKEETDIDGRLRADVCGKLVDDGQAGLCKYTVYFIKCIIVNYHLKVIN